MEITHEVKLEISDNYMEESESKPSTSISFQDCSRIKEEPLDIFKSEVEDEIGQPGLEMDIVKHEIVEVKLESLSQSPENLVLDWLSFESRADDVINPVSDDLKLLLLKPDASYDEGTSSAPLFKCNYCDHCSKYEQSLLLHIKRRHSADIGEKRFKCDVCDYLGVTKSELARHSKVHRESKEVPLYKCEYCDYQTKYKHHIVKHSITHMKPDEVPLYKCDKCDFQTKYRDGFVSHWKLHSTIRERRFKCDLCDYRSVIKSKVTKHSIVHKKPDEVPLYKCNSCDYQTKYKTSFLLHSKRHSGISERSFKCELCDYRGVAKSDVVRHTLVHKKPEEVRLYKCDKCDYQSKYRHSFVRHSNRHSANGERRFKCELCDYRGVAKSDVTKHAKVHKKSEKSASR